MCTSDEFPEEVGHMCTKYQIVGLAKVGLPIDLLWWIEAVPTLIPLASCNDILNEGAELGSRMQVMT